MLSTLLHGLPSSICGTWNNEKSPSRSSDDAFLSVNTSLLLGARVVCGADDAGTSLCSLAATIEVLMSMYGRSFSETRDTPPPCDNCGCSETP